MPPSDVYDIVIVGAGPAGLMAAIAAGRRGSRILVCERQKRSGRKLLASGGGRCNVTNALGDRAFASRFGEKSSYVFAALRKFGVEDICNFFESIGVPLNATDGIHFFPESNQAASVVEALVQACRDCGVVLRTGCDVTNIQIKDGRVCGIIHSGGIISTCACVLACGGKSYPKLSGCERGYELARQVGHSIVEPVTGLVGLITKETWPGNCAGISIENAHIRIRGNCNCVRSMTQNGSLLFTHHGISGPAVLNISSAVSRMLLNRPEVHLFCVLQEDLDAGAWNKRFLEWQKESGRKTLSNCLKPFLPARLVDALISEAGCDTEVLACNLSRANRLRLVQILTEGIELTVTKSEGWDRAMVTSGGVLIREIEKGTQASLLIKGLYLAGEMLDCSGPCGGFNITWALSSGFCAGSAAECEVPVC